MLKFLGYRSKRDVNGMQTVLPGRALKRDTCYQSDKKRKQCRKRAALEAILSLLTRGLSKLLIPR